MYYDSLKARVKVASEKRQHKREARALLDGLDIKQHIAPVYFPLHEDIEGGAHTTYNLPGGRGSCKSSFVSLEIVNGVMSDITGNSSAIVFRYVGATLRESCFNQIAWAIDVLGVGQLWKSRFSPMSYTYTPTGAQIIFRGLDDPSKLKSIKPQKGVFRFVWFEEFCELPGPNFLRNVMQSVQRGGNNFTVFRSFNPPISTNAWANVYIQEPDDHAVTLLTDYRMIPPEWLGEAFIYEAERLREVNPTAYRHEYLGEPTGNGSEVFPALEIRTITDEEINGLGYTFQGLDFGFAADPACVLRMGYDRKHETIYFIGEIYGRGLNNATLAERIKKNQWNDVRTSCDCAEPKSIMDLRDAGINAKQCYKPPNCIKYRIGWMQNRKIVIDPRRTPNAYREFISYCYDTDRDGNILPSVPDKDNHSIDAAAYGLERLIWTRDQGRRYVPEYEIARVSLNDPAMYEREVFVSVGGKGG